MEPNTLWLLLDDYDESYPDLYLNEAGELSIETVQRMVLYTDSLLDRPRDIAALEEQWQDWWPLVAVFTVVYEPELAEYEALSPLSVEAADELSPADVRYLREVREALNLHLRGRLE